MPHTIKLEHVPGGYATHCADGGEQIEVVFREFTSTEDGQRFISRLEGIPTKILEKITASANVAASQTNSLFAIVQPNGQTKVYWNEFQPTIQIRSKKEAKAGELVYIDHIMDIERVRLPDEALAPDVAICYLFSFGWRKGSSSTLGRRNRARIASLAITTSKHCSHIILDAFCSNICSRLKARRGVSYSGNGGFRSRTCLWTLFRI
jgi:hypothetical protein